MSTDDREAQLRDRMADQFGYTPPDARGEAVWPASPDERRALLVAGGKYDGVTNVQAAVHLLVFTDLPDVRAFGDLVHVERVHDRAHGETYTAALVDWRKLAKLPAAKQLHSAAQRLLTIAVGMATGQPVDLRDNLAGNGHAHARRILEAVAIATGAADFYTVTPTPELAKLEASHAEMDSGASL